MHYPDRPGAAGPTGMEVLLIGEDAVLADAMDGVAAAGLSPGGRTGWRDAADRLDTAHGLVLAEARGADPDALTRTLPLPLLDTLARTGSAVVIATCDFEQLDLVAALLDAPQATLLCAPDATERVAALGLAGAAGQGVRGADREAEAQRLRRLNEEVARIAETLARLTRDADGGYDAGARRGVGETPQTFRSAAEPVVEPVAVTAADIRGVIRARRLRDQMFGGGLFEDPAWDMLLDLFAAELERAQVSVSSLCIAAAVAPTTALRWIAKMTEAGLFVRAPDPFDRRRAFMALSEQASGRMRDYVAAVRRAGLGIA